MKDRNELDSLIDEIIRVRYSLTSGKMRIKFADISMSDYRTLRAIDDSDCDVYEGRIFLSDLADRLDLSIRKTSKSVAKLRDMGYVVWEHEGDGADGTFVLLTEEGASVLKEREKQVKEFFVKIVEKYGKEDMKALLQMLKRFETVMSTELEDEEDEDES